MSWLILLNVFTMFLCGAAAMYAYKRNGNKFNLAVHVNSGFSALNAAIVIATLTGWM